MTHRALFLAASISLQACAAPAGPAPMHAPETRRAGAAHLATLGERYARDGDLVRAQQYLASAWHADRSDPRILRTLLHVCIGASHLRAALGYAEAYIVRHPDAWQLRNVLAAIDLALGRRADARAQLGRVLADAPTHADAYYLLATISQQPHARYLYARYLALAPGGVHASAARGALQRDAATEPHP